MKIGGARGQRPGVRNIGPVRALGQIIRQNWGGRLESFPSEYRGLSLWGARRVRRLPPNKREKLDRERGAFRTHREIKEATIEGKNLQFGAKGTRNSNIY